MSQQEPSKPRQFLITDHTDNSGFSAIEVAYAVEHLACNVTHVVEKSYSDTLEQRIAVLEAGISKCRSNFHKEQSTNAELTRKNALYLEMLDTERDNAKKSFMELERKLAKAVEQRNEHFREALCGLPKQEQSEYIGRMDAELNGDK